MATFLGRLAKRPYIFLRKKKEEDRPPPPLPLPPLNTAKLFGPLVNVLTGFHCIFFEETSIILILNNFFSYFQCLQAVRENRNQAETERKPKRKSLAYDLAIEWFRNFSKNADHMPNSSSRPLPACLSKKAVYFMYKKEMGEKPVLGRSQFIYKMWKKNFPQVYIPKV